MNEAMGEVDPSLLPPNPERLGKAQMIAILDAGAQYGMDIEQQAKRQGFDAVRLPYDTPVEDLYGYGGIILSGGPESVYDESSPRPDPRLLSDQEGRPPLLGICHGEQMINFAFGGSVERLDTREDGFEKIQLDPDTPLLQGLGHEEVFVTTHGDTITEVAPGFEVIARSGDLIAGIANYEKQIYGVQFHPEVSPPAGPLVLKNFMENICGLTASYEYNTENFIEDAIQEVRESVGSREVLAYISGGVDSSALAKLLERALSNEQVSLVLVDHGFMRAEEIDEVSAMLAASNIHVQVVDAYEKFKHATTFIDGIETSPLDQVSDPEIKRKIIGNTFITVQEETAREIGLDMDNYILAMGTLYTDLIESGSAIASGKADGIKTHHNDTEFVRQLRKQGRVLEPWRFIQKDDVREVGRILGLDEAIYSRQPFPGPGLAIRIICGDTLHRPDNFESIVGQLNTFGDDSMRVDFGPIKSVGLQGDARTYANLALLSGERDWVKLKEAAKRIPNTVHDINRVAYVFGSPLVKTPDVIVPTFVNDETVKKLKQADAIVNKKLRTYGLDKTISQVPVILLPIDFDNTGSRSIAIRTFQTVNFKTGDVALPGIDFPEHVLLEIVDEILELPEIDRVLYDLTSKPPGTTEWE